MGDASQNNRSPDQNQNISKQPSTTNGAGGGQQGTTPAAATKQHHEQQRITHEQVYKVHILMRTTWIKLLTSRDTNTIFIDTQIKHTYFNTSDCTIIQYNSGSQLVNLIIN